MVILIALAFEGVTCLVVEVGSSPNLCSYSVFVLVVLALLISYLLSVFCSEVFMLYW